jgi:hypothetical protein
MFRDDGIFRVEIVADPVGQMQEEMKKKELERLKIAGIPIHDFEVSKEWKMDYYPS